jgi:hypothetical protein
MDSVDRYARLKDTIRGLEEEAAILRDAFLKPDARLRSNQFELVIKTQKRRAFQKDRLPCSILDDPNYWVETTVQVVSVRPLDSAARSGATRDDITLIEPF